MFDWWKIERPIEICQLWQKSRFDIVRKHNSCNEATPPTQSNLQCHRYLIHAYTATNSKSYHMSNIGNSVLTFLWWDRGWGHKYSYSHINTHLVHTLPLQRINASTIMIFLYFWIILSLQHISEHSCNVNTYMIFVNFGTPPHFQAL